MTGAAEWRMGMGGKMPLPDTFRVGSIMTTASIMPGGDKSALSCKGVKWRVPQAKVRAFISPLSGGRMLANGGSLRLENGDWRPVLTARKSQRRLSDIPKWKRARHREEGAVSGEKRWNGAYEKFVAGAQIRNA